MSESLQYLFREKDIVAVTTICLIYVLLLMLLMAVRLRTRQRSSAYIMLIFGLILMLTDRMLSTTAITSANSSIALYGLGRASLVTLSFILMNIAVLRLYKRINRRMRTRLLLLTASAPVMSAVSMFIVPDDNVNALAWFLAIWQAAIVWISYAWIAPRIAQQRRYTLSLAAYQAILLTTLLNIILYDGMNQWLVASNHFISLVYYTILFFIFFERIIEQLQHTYRSSITDGLTGLYNRKYMYQRMNQILKRNIQAYILFCDIDNFKKLNDTQGHLAADDILKKTSEIIQEEVEDIGLAGRFGGEELIAFVYRSRIKPAVIAETIRNRVEAETGVTISIGYTIYDSKLSVDQFVKEADEAMYHSKQTGKNRVTAYRDIRNKRAATT